MTAVYPFPWKILPMANISGMTYQDAATFVTELETLKSFVNESLIKDVNDVFADAAAQYQAGVTNAENAMLAFIANFTDELKTINNNAVTGMLNEAGNPARGVVAGMIDAAITALDTALRTYTDGEVTDLGAVLRAEMVAADALLLDDVAELTARVDTDTAANGYLVATFADNGVEGEKLHLFYSPDGKTLFGGNNNPAYTPADGQGVRDPSLLFWKGAWYVAYTSNNGNDKDVHIATSTTGAPGTWTLHTTLSGASVPTLNQMWAPQFITDNGQVYIYFSSVSVAPETGGAYWFRANNDALTGWTGPTAVNFPGAPALYIDATFIPHNGKHYMFYSVGSAIQRAVSTTGLTGQYVSDRTGDWAGWGSGIEGPELVKDGDVYRIYYDRYTANAGYHYSESTDLDTWTAGRPVATAPGVMNDGYRLRHGSFYKVPTRAVANLVLAGQAATTNRRPHMELTSVPGPTVSKNAYAKVAGWVWDENETTDKTPISFDAATGNITLKHQGVYAFTFLTGTDTPGVDNVTRALAEFRSEDTQTTQKRESGGVEDKFGCTVANHKSRRAGEVVSFRLMMNWAGTAATVTAPSRLKITYLGPT